MFRVSLILLMILIPSGLFCTSSGVALGFDWELNFHNLQVYSLDVTYLDISSSASEIYIMNFSIGISSDRDVHLSLDMSVFAFVIAAAGLSVSTPGLFSVYGMLGFGVFPVFIPMIYVKFNYTFGQVFQVSVLFRELILLGADW